VTTHAPRTSAASAPSRGPAIAPERCFAVVMAGGVGSRFWPWSRGGRPKQLLPLAGERSMLADTVARLEGLVPVENVFVVTGRRLRREVLRQLPSLEAANVLAEPVGRNTAPCIGWATLEVRRRREDALVVVLPADHVIRPNEAFRRDIARAFEVADQRRCLVTFGIPPTHPATGYGYIRAGAGLDSAEPARAVEAFVEKPGLEVAREYVAGGRHYWNSGMFVWRADVLWEELAMHLPALADSLAVLVGKRRRGAVQSGALTETFPTLESVSIDVGVLERSARVAMMPTSFDWFDIGSWDAVADLWERDDHGNASRDPLIVVDATGNVVATTGKPVALLGVRDLVVVDAGDALLVCPRDRCQDVRAVVDELRRLGLGRLL
jgi:mannose-1-phosphate guanylyltransferase